MAVDVAFDEVILGAGMNGIHGKRFIVAAAQNDDGYIARPRFDLSEMYPGPNYQEATDRAG